MLCIFSTTLASRNVLLLALALGAAMMGTSAAESIDEQIDDLSARYIILENAKNEFAQAQARGSLSTSEQNDFSAWIAHLSEQIVFDCNTLIQVEHAVLPDDLPCAQSLSSSLTPVSIDLGGERTETEQTNEMIAELNATLGEFDEKLLRDQERVKARKPHSTASAGGSAGGGADTEGSGQQTGETVASEAQGDQQGNENEAAQSQSAEDAQRPSTRTEKSTPGKALPDAERDAPEDIPDGNDDDVVARQLREAAEKETDPALKKKLWEEYRRYKAGTS